jgi:hypothetical protein
MDARLQARLGEGLKMLFAETAAEPTPRRFLELLDLLEVSAAELALPEREEAPSSAHEVRL